MIVKYAIYFMVGWVFALAFIAGCTHAPPAPDGMIVGDDMPAHLYCVSHDIKGACTIYRSAQPTAKQFSAMAAKLGLRSVVKLNSAWESRDVVPDGVERFENPWAPLGPVTHEQVQETLIDLYHAPQPVLVHCEHGLDRTGLLIALWRIKYEHVPAAAAWNEWRAYGKNVAWDKLFDLAFERETGYRP